VPEDEDRSAGRSGEERMSHVAYGTIRKDGGPNT
jgi:hypothetical protein